MGKLKPREEENSACGKKRRSAWKKGAKKKSWNEEPGGVEFQKMTGHRSNVCCLFILALRLFYFVNLKAAIYSIQVHR